MQAAGRMRLLGPEGQHLILVAPNEVARQLKKDQSTARPKPGATDDDDRSRRIDIINVLSWVMENVVDATGNGLSTWAKQGVHFAKTFEQLNHAPFAERLTLDELYSESMVEMPVPSIVESSVQACYPPLTGDGSLPPSMGKLIQSIRERAALYGGDFTALAIRLAKSANVNFSSRSKKSKRWHCLLFRQCSLALRKIGTLIRYLWPKSHVICQRR